MLKVENVEVFGWKAAIRGMRNPMNSWNRSDSIVCPDARIFDDCKTDTNSKCPRDNDDFSEAVFCIGKNDMQLMQRLFKGGTEHRKFMRMVMVSMDVTAPLYWWKEYDTYKVGTVANSCSTMHKIAAKEFTMDDFSIERLPEIDRYDLALLGFEKTDNYSHRVSIDETIHELNFMRKLYNAASYKLTRGDEYELTNSEKRHVKAQQKKFFNAMIQLLPSSYNQRRTVMFNYEVAANILRQRRNHKLDEWHIFCDELEKLPYLLEIMGRGCE